MYYLYISNSDFLYMIMHIAAKTIRAKVMPTKIDFPKEYPLYVRIWNGRKNDINPKKDPWLKETILFLGL